MLKSPLTGLAGLLVAREVEKGTLPVKLSVPLTVLISRLPVPALLLGAAGYGAYKLASAAKGHRRKPRTSSGESEHPSGAQGTRRRTSAAVPRRREA